jgi:Ankyrin repeats (many copies)
VNYFIYEIIYEITLAFKRPLVRAPSSAGVSEGFDQPDATHTQLPDRLHVPLYGLIINGFTCPCCYNSIKVTHATMPRDMTRTGRYPPQPRFPPFSFYSAVRLGDPELLATIMDVDPYFVTQDNGAGAPLHFAVTYGQLDMVHHLLNNGALVNQRDGKGWTPLHRAAHLSHLDGYLEVYELLLVSTYILPDPTQPHTMRAGGSMPAHTYTRIASTLRLTSQSRGADPSITTAAGDSYLSPGLKGVLDVALEHPDVRAALVDLNERYAGGHPYGWCTCMRICA